MAKTLENQRDESGHSIHGRRLRISHDDYLLGHKGQALAVNEATSDTTGTTITNYGYHSVESTTNDGFLLADPKPGVEVSLFSVSTSTGVRGITLETTTTTIVSSNGTAGSSITIDGLGDRITLVGISTSQYAVKHATATVSS